MSRVKTKEIPLKLSKWSERGDDRHDYIGWTRALPFAVNPRGVLVHRVRHVTTHLRNGVESHNSMHYLCGNGCCFELDSEDDVLVSDPPADRLLCQRCEDVAQRNSLPSGDQLAGRHVHRGVLVPKQTCCGGK
jgi:hypothetical protein